MNKKTTLQPHCDFPDLAGASILLVDDDESIRDVVTTIISDAGSKVSYAPSLCEALALSKSNRFDVALIDMVLPDASGHELIHHFGKHFPETSIIVITGHADHAMAYSLESAGVQSVLVKPFSASQLRFTLCKEIARRKLLIKEGVVHAHPESNDDIDATGLIGNSGYIKNLREKIRIFAEGNTPILIQGPTGTGKEIIARSIHRLSKREKKPMIIVNSSAIPEHLEESEFFGHTKGAFTGAHEEKDGIIACADGSSLFLDEVGELSLRIQAKLLRVLDGNDFNRVGESRPQKSDFRLISATNRPLTEMISEGTFRQDLYYRLKAGHIETKPLSSHKEDIPLLVKHFLFEFGQNQKKNFVITQEALDALVAYEWPGNIRELKNVIDSLCTINAKTRTISAESIEWVICGARPTPAAKPSFSSAKVEFEKQFYTNLLSKYCGNITASACEAGIDRPNFSKKLKALGIIASDFKVSIVSKKK